MELTQQVCRPLVCSPSFLPQPENTAFVAHACVRVSELASVCMCVFNGVNEAPRSLRPSLCARTSLSSHLSQPDHSSRLESTALPSLLFSSLLVHRLLSCSSLRFLSHLCGDQVQSSPPSWRGEPLREEVTMQLGLTYLSGYCKEGEQMEAHV